MTKANSKANYKVEIRIRTRAKIEVGVRFWVTDIPTDWTEWSHGSSSG